MREKTSLPEEIFLRQTCFLETDESPAELGSAGLKYMRIQRMP